MESGLKMMDFAFKMVDFGFKIMNLVEPGVAERAAGYRISERRVVRKDDRFCIKTEECCIKNERL